MSNTTRYESGPKHQVIMDMMRFAIRDQMALIDAHAYDDIHNDANAQKIISECNARIRDFRRFAAQAIKQGTPK